jgi:hypothetical protein
MAAQSIPQRLAAAFPDGDGFTWNEYIATGNVLFLGEAPDPEPEVQEHIEPDWSEILRFSQNNPQWKDLAYAGGTSFGSAGCFVVCVAMLAQASEPDALLTPPEVARALRDAGAFRGNLLSNPQRIPDAFPGLSWAGSIHYRTKAADMEYIAAELVNGPVIAEVAFDPHKRPQESQHFILIVSVDLEADTAMIADPWDGELKELTTSRYARDGWKASRIITGLRLVRLA